MADVPEGFRESGNPVHDQLRPILGQARMQHDRGNHESAAHHLCELEGFQHMLGSELRSEYLRLLAWVQSRRGFLDGILALDEMAGSQPPTFRLVNDYVCAYRYQGLVPPRGIEEWIKRGHTFLTSEGASSDGLRCHSWITGATSCSAMAAPTRRSPNCRMLVNCSGVRMPIQARQPALSRISAMRIARLASRGGLGVARRGAAPAG